MFPQPQDFAAPIEKLDKAEETRTAAPFEVRDSQQSADTKAVKWDEETIALHDLDRGTRMKIDEPKTPYIAPALSPIDAPTERNPSALCQTSSIEGIDLSRFGALPDPALDLKEQSLIFSKEPPSTFSSQVSEPSHTEGSDPDFVAKRKMHYRLGDLLRKPPPEDDDSDSSG